MKNQMSPLGTEQFMRGSAPAQQERRGVTAGQHDPIRSRVQDLSGDRIDLDTSAPFIDPRESSFGPGQRPTDLDPRFGETGGRESRQAAG